MLVVILLCAIIASIPLIAILFMKQVQFGKVPSGERRNKLETSRNFRDGTFHNMSATPQLTEGANMFTVSKSFFFGNKARRKPAGLMPSQKTDLNTLPDGAIVWFGHSSYLLHVDGLNILVDPVFSRDASPLKGSNRSFAGTDVYTPEDMPAIDLLVLTHDHWDHLDYPTVKKLKPKIKSIVTAIGVGAHLERWGFHSNQVREGDWGDEIAWADGINIHVLPARHFSGRTFRRNTSLWASFVLSTPTHKIYIGGDSGYDTHFKEIGNRYGPFHLAILECGQYNQSWKYIHMLPEETVLAAIDLKASLLFPVHWGKFALALHDWDEPIKRVTEESIKSGVSLIHPMIGQVTIIKRPGLQKAWWQTVS